MASNIPDSAESLSDSVDTQACSCRNAENKISAVKKKWFIDVSCEEIVDVKNSVKKYLEKLKRKIVSCYPHYRIENLVEGGSVVENTRVWVRTKDQYPVRENPLIPLYFVEFDYLAIMSGNGMEFREDRRACPGCIHIFAGNKEMPGYYKDVFDDAVYDIITDLDSRHQGQNSWQQKQNEIISGFDVYTYWKEQFSYLKANGSHRVIEAKSGYLVLISLKLNLGENNDYHNGPPLKFIWVRKVQPQEIQKNCGGFGQRVFSVHVDFLPAFELKQDPCLEREIRVSKMMEKSNIRNLRSTHIRYVVSKCSAIPDYKEYHCCWMVSTMLLEQKLIRRSSENHKDSYKLLKLFILKTSLNDAIPSYVLKTVYLHHLKECAISEGSVKDCYCAMIHSLSRMCTNDFVPHFCYEYNVFKHYSCDREYSRSIGKVIDENARTFTISELCLKEWLFEIDANEEMRTEHFILTEKLFRIKEHYTMKHNTNN